MRLLFHIGTHKTATTSIQHYLHENAALMKSRGVLYPSYELIGVPPHYAHLGMTNALVGEHHQYTPKQAEDFFKAVARQARDYELTIISGEPAYRQTMHDESGADNSDATYWTRRMRYIERLAELMPEAEIVIVFRRQAEYVQSMYQETVKKNTYRYSFRKFAQDQKFNLDFLGQARAWAKGFSAVRVMTFEELVRTGRVEESFCEKLGISTEGFKPPERLNEGMHAQIVMLKRILNQTCKDNRDAMERIERLRQIIGESALKSVAKCSYFGSHTAANAFQARFQANNLALAEFCDDPDFALKTICNADVAEADTYGEKPDGRILAPILSLVSAP